MDNLRMEQPGPLLTTHHHLLSSFAASSDLLHHRHKHNNHSSSNNSSSSSSNNNYLNPQQINVASTAPWLLNNNWTVDTHHDQQQHHSSAQPQQIGVQNTQHPWEISDPILQLNHRSSRDESVNTANGHSHNHSYSHSHGSAVFTEQADIPFACKLDDLDGRDVTFASLARSFDRVPEDLDNNSNNNNNNNSNNNKSFSSFSVKAEAVDESSLSLKSSDGSGSGSSSVKKEQQLEGGVTIASLEDGSIGLKLGKRTYYENPGVATAATIVAVAADENGSAKRTSGSCNMNNNTNNNNLGASVSVSAKNSTITTASTTSPATAAPVAKKQKSSANATVPKCQAEGCKNDLSGAKDYHRRHKVCEWHSKASKVKVANLEQRFCQQCSRFHVLSEFDEGKRSCRRRLAGHNERRRKPPPEPISLLSPGSFAYFADSRMNAALLEHPCFMQYRRGAAMVPPTSLNNTALACHLGLVGPHEEAVGNGHSLELHHFMQSHHPGGSRTTASGVGLLDEGTRSYMMMGNANVMALSQHQQHHHHHHPSGPSSTTSPAPSSSSQISLIPDRQQHSEVAISGRALSLLSSSLSSPVNPCTMSVSLGMASPSIDQILVQDGHTMASPHHLAQSSCFNSGINMTSAFQGLRHNSNHSLNSLTGSSSPDNMEQAGDRASLSSFDGRSMFLLPPEGGFGSLQSSASSQHGRPILDLMQVSSTEQPTPQQQRTEVTYSDLHELSIFGRQTMI